MCEFYHNKTQRPTPPWSPGLLATTSTAQRYEPNRRRAVLATKFQANGGGAKACTVELAKSQNGRANKTTVQKTPEISFGLHYQENLSENPWCAVIGIEVAALPPRKWIFSHIFLPVTPKTDFRLLCIKNIVKTNFMP